MQDPNEDTEWNDILRAKGIIPERPKEKEITEDDIVSMLEQTVKDKSSGNLDKSGKSDSISCQSFNSELTFLAQPCIITYSERSILLQMVPRSVGQCP